MPMPDTPPLLVRQQPVRYLLTLASTPSELPAEIRLKGVLKRLLRTYDFRCERVEELKPPAGPLSQCGAATTSIEVIG